MTKKEVLNRIDRAYLDVTPEMSSEETCAALEEIFVILQWLIEKLPEEEP